MNYSDYDSEDYSSSEDEDYVPSDDNLSEDDLNECEKEEEFDAEDGGKQLAVDAKTKKKKKHSAKGIGVRKRKKAGLKLEGEQEDHSTQREEGAQEKKEEEVGEDEEGCPAPRSRTETEKKKADDLWASFLSDVGPRPKLAAPASASSQKSPQDSDPDKKTDALSQPQEPVPKPKEPSKITITKVFDFAGEEVRVTKEVQSDSKEAKNFLKTKDKEKDQEKEPALSRPLAPGPSVKRPAGMSSILSQIGGKKQKMSTLEKSRLDWDAYKSEEGIGDELATHNRGKEGYIERKNFLERVDHRQFELEKNVRLANMKR
ncbi:hypothetical protein GJAV_G00064260 [Gymnothorax javanicus]|nr:hypothetical protein GJAV_G00064260 [Gymnothorax javanicus]